MLYSFYHITKQKLNRLHDWPFGLAHFWKKIQKIRTSTFFWRSPLSNWKLTIKKQKNPKNTQKKLFLYVCCVFVYSVFVMFCVFLYGPFCHGAHKLDLSTLFTTFVLWTSLPFSIKSRFLTEANILPNV